MERCERCDRQFPIIDGPSIPWSMLLPHERQAVENHDQSLAVLASRGGLGCDEALAILDDRKWRGMDPAAARAELTRRLAAESRPRLSTEERATVELYRGDGEAGYAWPSILAILDRLAPREG